MYTFLKSHAIQNVWCSPYQDRQHIFKAARLTAATGTKRKITLAHRDVYLPDASSNWHVYQIGQVHPGIMGLPDITRAWLSMGYVVNQTNMIIDIYTERGVHLPLSGAFIQVTGSRNVIVAVRKDQRFLFDFSSENVYFRFYTNAFYGSVRSDDFPYATFVSGRGIADIADITIMQNLYTQYNAYPGHVNCFINGRLVDRVSVGDFGVGDYVEIVWDGAVKRVVDISIKDIPSFLSELDSTRKYLLHYPGIDVDTIDYFDDIDFYLIKKEATGRFSGVFYHRNLRSAVRMLTHRDYAIRVDHVQSFVDGITEWASAEELTVRMVIRRAGFKRTLVDESSRIKELYKLSEDDLLAALTGTLSTLSEWSAPKLESAAYPQLMRALSTDITQTLIDDAYGYNAIAKLVADSPLVTEDLEGVIGAELGFSLAFGATVCEYDANGFLLGIYDHTPNTRYYARNQNATLIEPFIGNLSDRFDEYRDSHQEVTPFTIDPFYGWRFYICDDDGAGNAMGNWRDVTDDPTVVAVNSVNEVVWSINPNLTHTLIVSDKLNVVNTVTPRLNRLDDVLFFQVTSIQSDELGNEAPINLPFPKAMIFLWLNGKALIENIDYKIDWPNIMVYNKQYRTQNDLEPDYIKVFISGHPLADLSREQDQDAGFIKWGLLSRNSKYDIRDDKVSRIVVGGSVMHRDALLFSENDSGVAVDESLNGYPYSIDDIIIPLHEITNTTMRVMRAESKDLDSRISNYMTPLLPEPDKTTPTTTPQRHLLYSPFFTIVTRMMIGEYIERSKVESTYTEMELQNWLSGYEWALAYDPAYTGYDEQYLYAHPHPYSTPVLVNIYQWQFLERVNNVYFGGKLNMSNHYAIVPYEAGSNLSVIALNDYLGMFE